MRISDWSSDVCSSDLFLAALAVLPLAMAAAQAQAVELDVPAQRLDAALIDFAEQADVRLLYDAGLTRGSGVAQALKGDYSVVDGLQRLLEGSGLTFQTGDDGTITLVPLPEQGVLELGSTTISGLADGRVDLPAAYAGGQTEIGRAHV